MCVLEGKGREKEEEVRRLRERLRVEAAERDKRRETHAQVCYETSGSP